MGAVDDLIAGYAAYTNAAEFGVSAGGDAPATALTITSTITGGPSTPLCTTAPQRHRHRSP